MTQAPTTTLSLMPRSLRALSLDPQTHPRGQPHLSAASGLACAYGRAYVISDDEHHLAVFRDLHSPGTLHRIFAGDLPQSKQARKQLKPDLESLLLLPAWNGSGASALVAFGSGSRPNRDTGVVIPLNALGEPSARVRHFDLKPLYEPLRDTLGEINIEGAMLLGDELVLLNRSVAGRSDNAALHYRASALRALIGGQRRAAKPRSVRRYALGAIHGVELGFTDGTPLPGGGWVFSAAAEDTTNSYADGPFSGAVLGVVDARGDLLALHRLATPYKVEGLAARRHAKGIDICMVTDADDPLLSSQLLLARL